MKNKSKQILIFLFLFSILMVPCFVFAAYTSPINKLQSVGQQGGYAQFSENEQIFVLVSQIISVALSLLGVIFFVLMIYGGFLWMTDRGNEKQVEKAKKIMEAAIIGLVLVVSAYAITKFVMVYFVTKSAAIM
jgi:hypothetical protein